MATLKEIRARIKAAKNIQQITKAMKLVSAARLKKATDRVLEARPYADKMRELMSSISEAGELPDHPLLDNRPIRNLALILITSDRGLAGAYNTSLIRKATEFIRNASSPVKLITVGKTSYGKPWTAAIISSPANLARLDQIRATNMRLAHPEGLTDPEAKRLASEGRAIVDISGGLHA